MRYHENPRVDALLRLAGSEALRDTTAEGLPNSLTITAALIELLEDRAWATIWWAYGALHHLLDDESLDRAQDLLKDVRGSAEARAASLIMRAATLHTLATHQGVDPDEVLQLRLLEEAVTVAPDWPAVHIMLAESHNSLGARTEAARHASRALELLAEPAGEELEPFEVAIARMGVATSFIREHLVDLGAQ